MIDLYVVGRAVGKTTFTLETMYREPDWLLIVSSEAEAKAATRRLAERCVQDGPPPWYHGHPYANARQWEDWWFSRVHTPQTFHRARGLINRPKVAIDNVEHVLQVMFGDVQMATATSIIPRQRIPTLPRIKCVRCGGPYDEETDFGGLCATCLDAEPWERTSTVEDHGT